MRHPLEEAGGLRELFRGNPFVGLMRLLDGAGAADNGWKAGRLKEACLSSERQVGQRQRSTEPVRREPGITRILGMTGIRYQESGIRCQTSDA